MKRSRLTVRLKDIPLRPEAEEDEQQLKKQTQQINLLFSEDDFTVQQLFHILQKSKNRQKVLSSLDPKKLNAFLSKNCRFFIETQEQLLSIHMQQPMQVKLTVHNKIEDLSTEVKQQGKQSSIFEILDSFNNSVFEENREETLRLLKMLRQMHATEKYEKYFYKMDIAKMSRDYYSAWIDTCKDQNVLLEPGNVGGVIPSIKLFFSNRTETIINQMSSALTVGNFQIAVVSNQLTKLLQFIIKTRNEFLQKYKKYEGSVPMLYAYSSRWIESVATEFYGMVSGDLFQHDDFAEILLILSKILLSAAEMEVNGLSLVKIFKNLIITDLGSHLETYIDIISQSFSQILKDEGGLYELKDFENITTICEEMEGLKEIDEKDCKTLGATKKTILLLNSYKLLLQPIFDKKWQFLHPRVLLVLCQKSKQVIDSGQLSMWDCYVLFRFFQDLQKGKIKNKVYNNFTEQYKELVKKQLTLIQQFAKSCWKSFECELTFNFFRSVLYFVPRMLYENGKIYASKTKNTIKPQSFATGMVDLWFDFLRQFESRLSPEQYQYLCLSLYEYFIYMVEYVIYISYHGQDDKSENYFILPKKHSDLWEVAKILPLKQIPEVQEGKMFKLSYFTPFGMESFVFDMHFIAYCLNKLAGMNKISAELFLGRLVKVQQKEKKNEPVEHRLEAVMSLITKYEADVPKNFESRIRPSNRMK